MEGQSRGQQVLAINLAFFILAVITVGLRLVTRFRVVHNAGRDDACIVASVVRLELTISTSRIY